MNRYLSETKQMDYSNEKIQQLIESRGYRAMDEYDRIKAIYEFVKEEIKFGYNEEDSLPASVILQEGMGQCNTKACLLMTLLRAVGVPCRLHAFYLNKLVQKGVVTGLNYRLTPDEILHTWVEVWYQEHWVALEGVILDEAYLQSVIHLYGSSIKQGEAFQGYGIGVNQHTDLRCSWSGQDTFIQSAGIVKDLGVFDTADDCFQSYEQKIGWLKKWIYQNIVRKKMNRRVNRIRNTRVQ